MNTTKTTDDSLWVEDRDDEPWLHIGDRGEWYAFRMTPEKARAWARVLLDFADGKPVPARPAGEERAPWMPEFYERSVPAPRQGDEVPGLDLGTFNGQPVKARYL